MKKYAFAFCLCMYASIITALPQDATSLRPHVPRQGANLIVNPSIKTTKGWRVMRSAGFDPAVSRTKDGSGSFKLTVPIPDPQRSTVLSDLVPVQSGQRYTCAFYLLTANGPTYVGVQIVLHDSNKRYIRNYISARGGASEDGGWQEFALPFTVPANVSYIRVEAYKTENTKPGGRVWVDDFYLGVGLGLEQAPSPKKGFAGAHVRIDTLGNFEVRKKTGWIPFFPLCMYSDNRRDWSVYSRQGWNTMIWAGAAHQVKQAREAVSEFNPDGMMAGFQISQYTFPSSGLYNNLKDLRTRLRELFDQGLGDNLLLYYWDNENHHDQWQVPAKVITTIKGLDVNSAGKRLHPIYALQGTFNIARVHAAKRLVDVSGAYFGGTTADTGGAGQGGHEGFFVLDRIEGQTSPAAFAQFNGVNGPGDMRLRLYNAILLGAKAIGYWRDCFSPDQQKEFPSVGPVDKKDWWPDFPNLRREVDILLPLIRNPHWTSWAARVGNPNEVRIGTRNHKGECYLLLVNQTVKTQQVTIALEGLPYAALEVRDMFNDQKVASINEGTFTVTLPENGINSGTKVLRIVSSRGNR